MGNLSKFSKRMKTLGKRIETNANKEAIQLGSLISQTVILATPVDEGTARANWFATLGVPERFADFNAADPSGQLTISRNDASIQKQTEQTIYITNNLPYIKRLNDGWSAQAPAGYVEAAVDVAKKKMKEIRLLKK